MTSRAAEFVDVILRDGTTLRLRPPGPDDADAVLRFFEGLSEQSLYLRFHGLPALRPALVEPFVAPDWAATGALVGELAEDGSSRVVALASYARLRDPSAAEVAFAVDDALQGRGVGTRLLEQLAVRAREEGVERFVAEVMSENRPMLRVFEDAGFELTRELAGGTLEVEFPIAPTARFVARLDERDHVAVVASLRPFFEPAGVAVVGASRRRGTIGGELFRNILEGDFQGAATRSTATASRSRACAPTARSRRSRIRSTSPSSACPPPPSTRPPSRRCARACGRWS
jgi:RimJ/RimL family protein N-acetyltransferase